MSLASIFSKNTKIILIIYLNSIQNEKQTIVLCLHCRSDTYWLTLESRRFPVLGEVSCFVRTLITKETEQGVTITLYHLNMYLHVGW